MGDSSWQNDAQPIYAARNKFTKLDGPECWVRWQRHQSSHRASSMNHQAISPDVDTNWASTRDCGYLVQYAVRPPTPFLFTKPQSEQSPGAVLVRCPGWPSLCGCAKQGPEIEKRSYAQNEDIHIAVFLSKSKKFKQDIGGEWGQSWSIYSSNPSVVLFCAGCAQGRGCRGCRLCSLL